MVTLLMFLSLAKAEITQTMLNNMDGEWAHYLKGCRDTNDGNYIKIDVLGKKIITADGTVNPFIIEEVLGEKYLFTLDPDDLTRKIMRWDVEFVTSKLDTTTYMGMRVFYYGIVGDVHKLEMTRCR